VSRFPPWIAPPNQHSDGFNHQQQTVLPILKAREERAIAALTPKNDFVEPEEFAESYFNSLAHHFSLLDTPIHRWYNSSESLCLEHGGTPRY
jgi:hypothetical protein